MPIGSHVKRNDRHKLASIVSGELVWIDTNGIDPPDVLVASEYAPSFAVDLPLAQHRMRVAAAPFAVEDRVAQPIDDLHVALGREVSPRRYLVSTVAKAKMSEWRAELAARLVTPRRLIPDATTLRPPEPAAGWAVRVDGERVLVRTRDDEAFATSIRLLPALWAAAGCPALQQAGPGWHAALPVPVLSFDAIDAAPARRDDVDLGQSAQQDSERRYSVPLKVAAAMLAAAAAAHTAILSLDAAFVSSALSERRTEVSRLVASVAPLAPAGDDPATVLAGMLPGGGSNAGASRFLPMLAQISSAIQPVAEGIAVQALSYDAADGAMLVDIEASDLPALERVERSLTAAGFSTESGGASVGEGRAESSFTIRDGVFASGGGGAE